MDAPKDVTDSRSGLDDQTAFPLGNYFSGLLELEVDNRDCSEFCALAW